jgi:hypothetical protein
MTLADRRAEAAHEPKRPVRAQHPLGGWSTRGSALSSLGIRWSMHSTLSWHGQQRVPSGQLTGRCSPTASRLPHAPAKQEYAGGKALEQDDDMVAVLTDVRRRCRVASVVGEVDHALGSFSEVGGCFGTSRGRKGEAG